MKRGGSHKRHGWRKEETSSRRGLRKGLSPVIATVLLIGIVVVAGLIVFTWFRGFTQEAVTKFDQNAQLVCNEIEFKASIFGSELSITNLGNVPIYGLMIKYGNDEGFQTRDIKELSAWPKNGLILNGVFSGVTTPSLATYDDVTVIPILRGSSQRGGEASFVCDEAQHGYKLS